MSFESWQTPCICLIWMWKPLCVGQKSQPPHDSIDSVQPPPRGFLQKSRPTKDGSGVVMMDPNAYESTSYYCE